MTKFIKTIFASAIVLFAACGVASCSSDSNDEPDEPGTTVVPDFTFECKEIITGGSSTILGGSMTSTSGSVVTPVFENENTIITTLYRNAKHTVEGVTTGGEEFVYVGIYLSKKYTNDGWELTSSKLTYDGITYDRDLKVPYDASMGSVLKVDWDYTVERNSVKVTQNRKLSIVIVDKMP